MRKPIAVLYIPTETTFGYELSAIDLMQMFNGHDENRKVNEAFYDYLWFVFVDTELNAPKIQVFHEKDFTDIQYDELMQLIETEMSKLNK